MFFYIFERNTDPDKTPRYLASHLGIHCLLIHMLSALQCKEHYLPLGVFFQIQLMV